MTSRCLLITILAGIIMVSCSPVSKVAYFEKVKDATYKSSLPVVEAPLQKNDILTINISSLNAEASAIFNPPSNKVERLAGSSGGDMLGGGYLIDTEGNIQIPMLGTIEAAGLTKTELKTKITDMINERKLLIDPVVDIRYLNYEVTIIGEVAKPTVITVPSEKISLVKALGLAGDLTIYGKRDNILLIREEAGQRLVRHLNINSPDFLNSPYYYLQPDDVVYVEPNRAKIASASRSQQLVPIILSSLSIIVVVITALIR